MPTGEREAYNDARVVCAIRRVEHIQHSARCPLSGLPEVAALTGGVSLRLLRGMTDEQMATWLSAIGADSAVNRFSVLRWPAMALEVVATRDTIFHYVLVAESHRERLLSALRAALPGARLEEAPDYMHNPTVRAAVELRVTSWHRLLAQERATSTSAVFLASLLPLNEGETIQAQWIIAGTPIPSLTQSDSDNGDPLSWLLKSGKADRELLRAERLKYQEPLLKLSGRIAVSAEHTGRARSLLARVVRTLHLLNAPGISVTRRLVPSFVAAARFTRRWVPLGRWPIVANTKEAVGLLGLPVGELHLPGLALGAARQLPPHAAMSGKGIVVGQSNYPGMTGQSLALKVEDRLRHQYILGPTGTGKSTLLANMARQDAEAGRGLILIDPKATDFAYDVLARLPDKRLPDVIVLDPANTRHPVGFNPLKAHGDEHARELAAETTVHIFRDIFHAYWGPRTDDLMRAAVSSLAQVQAPNGQSFTMCEVAELLTSPGLRRYVVSQPTLDQRWKDYWLWYDSLSEGERLNAIGAVLNKLRAFTTRSSLRLVLGQSEGINIADVFAKRKILLVPLAKGQIGVEASVLLGSLLVGALWQATLARSAVPAEKRHPVFAYLDEFQDVVRLADDLGDMLAQARGLGLGVVLAHQYVKQIPDAIRAAVLGTARTQLVFQVEHDDAWLLEKRFAPALSAHDLMGLQAYEAAMRPCVNGQTLSPVTLRTLPQPEPRRDAAQAARQLAEAQGVARAEIESGLRARIQVGPGQLGRRSRREVSQ